MGGKRGVLFTILVIIILSIVTLIAFSRSRYTAYDKQQAMESRITAVNDFVKSFDADAKRAIYISTFRTLVALEDYASRKAAFLNDTDVYFEQIFYNGSIEGENVTFDIMNGSTFRDYQEKVNEIAYEINLVFNSSVEGIDLSMRDPWTVRVSVKVQINLSDQSGLASWVDERTIVSDVPIIDLRDPLYSVKTLGKLPVQIKRTNITLFVNDTDDRNDTFNLQYHLNHSLYTNSSMAPNFLMRFEGNLSPDVNGIESLVNLQVLADQGVVINNNTRSVVDYIYFGDQATPNYCDIQNMVFHPDDWFILDRAHAEIYQVNTTLGHRNC